MRVPIALLAVLLVTGVACARTRAGTVPDAARAKLDVPLRRLAASGADTVVGVFIEASRPVGAAEVELLERAGVRVGTVTGELLTGRVSTRRLAHVAALPLVRRIELSRQLRPQGPPSPGTPINPVPDGAA